VPEHNARTAGKFESKIERCANGLCAIRHKVVTLPHNRPANGGRGTEEHHKRAKEAELEHSNNVGQITFERMRGLTKAQERCVTTAQKHRIVTPPQRRDENV
jgi:hypothetical protein